MLHCLPVLIIAATVYLSICGCDTRPLGSPETAIIGSANVALIRSAESGRGYLIDGSALIASGDNVDANTADYPVTKDLGAFPQDQISELATILLDPKTYEWEAVKGCIPTPGVKLGFRSASHQIDILFCFECDTLIVYRDGKYVSAGNFDFGRPRIVDFLKANFPDDPIIQSLDRSP